MVKNPPCNAGDVGSVPGQGTEIPHDGGLVAKLCPTLATQRSAACQGSLSMGFPRQEYWNGLPLPSPGDFPNSGTEPVSPELAHRFFNH